MEFIDYLKFKIANKKRKNLHWVWRKHTSLPEECKTSADEAEVSAQRAEQAMNTAGYIHMEIREDGHLWMQKTDGVDVDFYLGDDGHLYLTTE